MKIYKIKHKPTGLFFTPNKGMGNLSTNGKIYPNKPSLKHIPESIKIDVYHRSGKLNKKSKLICEHFGITRENYEDRYHGNYWSDAYINIKKNFSVPKEDWEIIEII